MGAPRRSLRQVESQAADVLSGRGPARPDELLDLVHELNPTGRDLPREEAARRYRLKARLQSLLVQRFAERLRLEPVPGRDDVVGLSLPPHGDACHAVLAELDEEARALVRRRLDAGEAGDDDAEARRPREEKGRARRPEPDDDSALERGLLAAREWDFEAARAHLRRALDEGAGAPAALALAGLLVDSLADDEAALELEASLAPDEASAEVRALLALAAARLGRPERAAPLLRANPSPRAADALSLLARDALARGRAAEAAALVARVREHDAAHPSLVELDSGLDLLRQGEREAAEQELRRALAEAPARAPALARELLARHPDSALARQVAGAEQERVRREALAQQTEAARRALERGEVAAARELLKAAEGFARDEGERAALAALRKRTARAAEAERVQAVARALEAGADAEALEAFLGLDAAAREAVRARAPGLALRTLEELARGAGRPGELARAAADVGRARSLLQAGDPAGALALLEPHGRLLERSATAAGALADARAAVRERRHAAARAGLDAAREACRALEGDPGAGSPELVRRQLEALDVAALADAERAEWHSLHERAAGAARQDEALAQYRRLLKAQDFYAALRLVDRCFADAGERAQHEARLRQFLAVTHAVAVTAPEPGADGLDEPALAMDLRAACLHAATVLDEDGHAWIVQACASHVELRALDLRARRQRLRGSLRAPGPLDLHRWSVAEGRLWVSGVGGTLGLRVAGLQPEAWFDGPRPGPTPWVVVAPPGSGVLWLSARTEGGSSRLQIRRLPDGLLLRDVAEEGGPLLLADGTGGPPRVALLGAQTRLRTAHGAPLEPCFDTPPEEKVRWLGPAPGGPGLVGIVHLRVAAGATPSVLARWDGQGRLLQRIVLEGSDATLYAALAVSLPQRLCFALAEGADGRSRLHAFAAAADGTLQERWARPVPAHGVLVRDAGGRHVAFLTPRDAGLDGVLLGEEPPPPLDAGAEPEPGLRWLMPPFECPGSADVKTLDAWNDLGRRQPSTLARAAAERSSAWVRVAWRLLREQHPERARIMLADAARRPAHDANAQLTLAEAAILEGDWAAAARRLEATPEPPLPAVGAHLAHLRALAALELGQPEQAVALLTGRTADRHACPLDALLELARAQAGQAPEPGAGRTAVRLWRAVRTADERLACGDAAGALAALEHAGAYRHEELQSSVRLVRAWLATEPGDESGLHRKALGLQRAFQVLEFRSRDWFCRLPPAAALPPEEQLAALEGDVVKWLGARDLRVARRLQESLQAQEGGAPADGLPE